MNEREGKSPLEAARRQEKAVREAIVARYEARRRELATASRAREADLPLRLLRQTSHFTTPASNLDMIRKAASGIPGARKLLEKLDISPLEVAAAFGCEPALVEAVLATRGGPPFVMIDGEDATALDPAVLREARANAILAFTEIDWGDTLAFYRPSGIALEYCVEDLATVVGETAARASSREPGRRFPIDGVVWPKVEHEDELTFLDDLLSELEGSAGLERRTIKVSFLVEAGRALARLERIVDASLPRLASVILGTADYCADVGIPEIRNDHPSCDWARAGIVNLAGAIGVPAIDAMTFDYPVKDPALDASANKRKILGAMRACYEDARHGIALGMDGKWVGHPLQLLANEIAFRGASDPAALEKDVADTRAYLAAVGGGRGAAVISGLMADRATDRHVRRRLRRALARGALSPGVARELGIAAASELESR
jgi:citrate lyase beta subunit